MSYILRFYSLLYVRLALMYTGLSHKLNTSYKIIIQT